MAPCRHIKVSRTWKPIQTFVWTNIFSAFYFQYFFLPHQIDNSQLDFPAITKENKLLEGKTTRLWFILKRFSYGNTHPARYDMEEVKHSLKISFFSVHAAKTFFLMWQNYLTRRWDTEQGLQCCRTQSKQSIRPFLQSSELGPPPPQPQASVSPPPLRFRYSVKIKKFEKFANVLYYLSILKGFL